MNQYNYNTVVVPNNGYNYGTPAPQGYAQQEQSYIPSQYPNQYANPYQGNTAQYYNPYPSFPNSNQYTDVPFSYGNQYSIEESENSIEYFPATSSTISKATHQLTIQLLNKSAEIAGFSSSSKLHSRQVTADFASAKPRSAINISAPLINYIDNSVDNSWNINSRNNYINKNSYNKRLNVREKTQQEKDKDQRILFGVLSSVVLLIGSFFLGGVHSEKDELKKLTANFKILRKAWATNKNSYQAYSKYQNSIERIIQSTKLILERRLENNAHKAAIIIAGLIAAGLVLGGAIAASQTLVLAGGTTGLGVGMVALYKLGYYCFSNAENDDIKTIRDELKEIRKLEGYLEIEDVFDRDFDINGAYQDS